MPKAKKSRRSDPPTLLPPLNLTLLRRGCTLCSVGGSQNASLVDAAAMSVWSTYTWQRELYNVPATICLAAVRQQWNEIATTGRVTAAAVRWREWARLGGHQP